jgi:hypothetical protein
MKHQTRKWIWVAKNPTNSFGLGSEGEYFSSALKTGFFSSTIKAKAGMKLSSNELTITSSRKKHLFP